MADLSKFTLPDDSVRNLKDAAARDSIATINTKVGSATLTTTAPDLSGAINEHEGDITALNNSLTLLPLIQRGCKKNVSLSASGQTEVNVALDTPITSDYIVCANIVFYGTANTFALIVRDRGQSSFTLRVYNSNNVAVSVEIDWIAIPI